MKPRTCTRCGVSYSKPKLAFQAEKFGKDGLRSQCTKCRMRAQKHYRKHSAKAKNTLKQGFLKRRERNRQFVRAYLEKHPCVDCGEARWQVLEFDHVRGSKLNNIAWMVSGTYSIVVISKEIAKCQVRCANCHRLKTAKQFGWYST